MNIFITGGSGFLGGHLINGLRGEHRILALARSERSAAIIRVRGAEPVSGALDTLSAEQLQDIDVIIHAAAHVEEWGPLADFEAANVAGTERLLEAARAAGVPRFVHISTNAVVVQNADQLGVDEDYSPSGKLPFHYATTKAAAERAVLAANSPELFTLALRPCFIWGPGDTTLLPAIAAMAEQGRFMWLDGGRKSVSTTHVDNLVHAVRLSLTQGRGGQPYFIADEDDLTLRAFVSGLAQTRGIALPETSVPGALVRPVAGIVESTWVALGIQRDPPVTRMAASLMSTAMTVRTDKARRELEWAPVVDRSAGLAAL